MCETRQHCGRIGGWKHSTRPISISPWCVGPNTRLEVFVLGPSLTRGSSFEALPCLIFGSGERCNCVPCNGVPQAGSCESECERHVESTTNRWASSDQWATSANVEVVHAALEEVRFWPQGILTLPRTCERSHSAMASDNPRRRFRFIVDWLNGTCVAVHAKVS
jgi:hypothetical protein